MRQRRTWIGLSATGGAALLAVVLLAAGPAQAGCSPSDLADALINTVGDGASFLKNHAKCAPHFSDPAYWVISGGVTAAAASSSDVKSTCQDIENLDASAGGYQQKVKSIYDKLPADAQQAINDLPGVGNINSSAADLSEVLSFVSCACAFATESGVTQITEVAGSCIQDIMCWADDVLFDNPCTAAPPPKLVDCANGHEANNGDIINSWNDSTGDDKCSNDICYHISYVDGPVSDYCYCPKPMVGHQVKSGDGQIYFRCECPPHTHRPDCPQMPCPGQIDWTNPVLARVCLCDSTNELVNADGTCPPPCNCGCENNQIILAKDTNTCTCTCGCPDGQALVGGKCVKSCSGANQILLANGSCCSPEQATSCGTCCPFNTKPDPVSGSCVYAPMPPPPEIAIPRPQNNP